MQTNYIVELDEQNFQSTLEQSLQTPVLVYFWANVIPESVELLQPLTNLAHEFNGAFILASLDCEKNQMLAAQFGVQGLPTLALFSKGRPVDGLSGPQPIEAIREMLTPHLPDQNELAFNAAKKLIEDGEYNQALTKLKLLESHFSELGEYKLALAQCYVETDQFDQAETILETVLMQDQDALYKGLVAKIDLHKQAADSDEIRDLQQAYDKDPSNHKLAYELAIQLSQIKQQEQALEILLAILKKDLNFADGDAKKTTMDILSALGQGNELASKYRRKLYALLY